MDKEAALVLAAKDLYLELIKKHGMPGEVKVKPADSLADGFGAFMKRLKSATD